MQTYKYISAQMIETLVCKKFTMGLFVAVHMVHVFGLTVDKLFVVCLAVMGVILVVKIIQSNEIINNMSH